jgi:hypothetical protein
MLASCQNEWPIKGDFRRLCPVQLIAKKGAAIAAEVVRAGFGELGSQRVAFLPGASGFVEIAFNPVESACGSPIVGVEFSGLSGLHPIPPEARALGIVSHQRISKDKCGVQLGGNIGCRLQTHELGIRQNLVCLLALAAVERMTEGWSQSRSAWRPWATSPAAR